MNTHALAVMGICAAVTLATRALPFVCFGQKRAVPRLVTSLGHSLPPAIMAALVVYCLKGVDFTAWPFSLAEVIAVAVTALLHLWKRNTLLSIAAGTVCYMILIRTVFPI